MTSIEWTMSDEGVLGKTWNPCVGCTKCSPGCKHCYAKTMHARLTAMGQAKYAEPFETVRPFPPHLTLPLTWKKGRRIFVNSMSDLFHEDMPDEYIAAVFGVMAACPQHTFQILTKRAERLPRWFAWVERQARECNDGRGTTIGAFCLAMAQRYAAGLDNYELLTRNVDAVCAAAWPLDNAHLGVSIEDKERSERMVELARVPAAVRFLSIEPLLEDLGDIGLAGIVPKDWGIGYRAYYDLIHWVIVGGESGPGARPFNIEWARSIVRQCKRWDVPVFVKQLGASPRGVCSWKHHDRYPPAWLDEDGTLVSVSGRKAVDFCHSAGDAWWPCAPKLKDKKGGDINEWPADLRVREFPTART